MRKYLIWTSLIWLITILLVVGYVFHWWPLNLIGFGIVSLVIFAGATKHPREFFWLFLALLPLENIIISPTEIPFSLRPFQLVGGILVLILLLSMFFRNKKINFRLLRPKCSLCSSFGGQLGGGKFLRFQYCFGKIKDKSVYLNPLDKLVFILGITGLVSVQYSSDKILSFKLSVILISFIALYWMTRNFVSTFKNVLESVWFFMVGSVAVILFGLYQVLAEKFGWQSLQVMEKRINASFVEPDWLGMYLVFVVAVLLATKYVVMIISRDKNGRLLQRVADIRIFHWSAMHIGQLMLNFMLGIITLLLILTVARSAWLGMLIVSVVYLIVIQLKLSWREMLQEGLRLFLVVLSSIVFLQVVHLSDFHLGNRATSSLSGWQKITISCQNNEAGNGKKISNGDKIINVKKLSRYNCRHINLEEINSEKGKGQIIKEVYRPDPNIEIRKNIYKKTWLEIKKHWLFGQGLGSSGSFLGKDNLGHRLNTSNIFLEVWLSLGIVGLLPFLLVFFAPLIIGLKWLQIRAGIYGNKSKEFIAVFLLLTFFAILLPNLFNAGFLLGFFWIWLAMVVGILGLLE